MYKELPLGGVPSCPRGRELSRLHVVSLALIGHYIHVYDWLVFRQTRCSDMIGKISREVDLSARSTGSCKKERERCSRYSYMSTDFLDECNFLYNPFNEYLFLSPLYYH